MVIPSLDDEPTEEDITLKVAEAPERYTREMQSLHELDAGIKDQLGTRFAARSGEQARFPPPLSLAGNSNMSHLTFPSPLIF